MQGILVMGGKGTRLNLFSRRVNNKGLAIVYDRLIFEYPLNTLVRAGITDITVVTGYRYAGHLMDVIGDGKEFGVNKIHYVYQKEARGISDAISKAKEIIHDKCAVILGDNFFEDNIKEHVDYFENNDLGCMLFSKAVPDPERYGVIVAKDNASKYFSIEDIEEKPKNPKTNLAATGLYFYDSTLFDRIDKLVPSNRGELEVTDLNMAYVKDNRCKATQLNGYWNDMGTFDSILETSNFVKNNNYKLSYSFDAWKNS